jgi:hypothetical protein
MQYSLSVYSIRKIKIFIYQNYLDGIKNYFKTNYRNYL